MWTDRDQTLDITHNPEELWFPGIFGRPVAKPPAITKWENSPKLYQVIDKTFPRTKASAVLSDLGIIALENARAAVRQRQTFRATNKAENVAPLTFEFDPDGQYAVFAATLRNRKAPRKDPGRTRTETKKESDEGKSKIDDDDNAPILDLGKTPTRMTFFRDDEDTSVPATPLEKWEGEDDDHHATNLEFQQLLLEEMIAEPDSGVTEQDRKILSMYISLTSSEFMYVLELQRAYDETRCYYCQWVISKEIKELVNSARLTAMNEDKRFTWTQVKREILNCLVDVTHTARLLTLTQLERGQSSARLWISQLTSKRALLEDKDLASPILLPEIIYLELALGRLSPQECNTFSIPTLGDDLMEKDGRGNSVWTLAKLKSRIDSCTQPPPFRGTKSPITELLNRPKEKTKNEFSPKGSPKPPHDKSKGHERKAATPGNDRRPAHERPTSFPATLKRPDPKMMVNGKSISSEQQQAPL